MKVVLFIIKTAIQSGRKFVILAKDFKFDLMLFLDIDTRMC